MAVIWPKSAEPAVTLGIDDRGQVVGSSGSCANTVVTAVGLSVGPNAVLWENGSVTNLGSLKGTMGKAGAINDRGEVAEFSGLPGDSSVHSFLWTKGLTTIPRWLSDHV